jgi:nanoRNase/pAp phosphatase (c-di-AMP/oligoRNAs hydrolase)
MPSISSYLLENIVLEYYENNNSTGYIDFDIRDIFRYLVDRIYQDLQDPKGIQGNINTLIFEDKIKISYKANNDFTIANNAIRFETQEKNHISSIIEWRKIFGSNFPDYG